MVDMEGKDIVIASILIYLVPLISLVIGIFIGTELSAYMNVDENLLGIIFGLVFMGITYLGLKKYDEKIRNHRPNKFKPKIVKKLS